jgi:hypothetical protein
MATLAKLLQVDMDLPSMAKRLAAAGRGKDSILAHINPKEAALLRKHGGKGTPNPDTGIIEFDDGSDTGDAYATPVDTLAGTAAGPQAVAENAATTAAQEPYGSDYGVPITPTTTPSSFAPTSAPAPAAVAPVAKAPVAPAPMDLAAQYQSYGAGRMAGESTAAAQEAGAQPTAEPGILQKALTGAKGLASSLSPYAKLGVGALGLAQGQKAAGQVSAQSQANEAEIRKLADPYRQQGQQLVSLGQAGQLTAPQQQQIEALRAQSQQQLSQAGVTGGTAAMQAESQIERTAQQYAQDNINQGLKLMGVADKYITDAIQAGYTGAKDAAALTKDFYSQIANMLPTTAGGTPVAAKPGD